MWEYLLHGHCDFDGEYLEDLKNFFQGQYDANTPKKTIVAMTEAKPLIITKPLSLLVTEMVIMCFLPTHSHVVPTTDLTLDFALVNNVTLVCHILTINVVSARKPTQWNGLSAKCTTPPLVPRLPKTLRHFVKV